MTFSFISSFEGSGLESQVEDKVIEETNCVVEPPNSSCVQDTGFVSCVPAVSSPVDVAKGLKNEARKFECPVCLVKRRDLPLHMRKIHFWSVAGSKSVVSQFD